MLLLVGLGNPGAQYEKNRHNIGFMAVDAIAERAGFGPERGKFQSLLREGRIGGDKALCLKPQTYMNLSGQAVAAAMRFYKLTPADVVVLHDELDLAPGKVRVKTGGGHAGHNGLRSIHAHIGAEFRRIRLGIGHPGDKNKVSGYVLHDFAKAEWDWIDPLMDACAAHAGLLADGEDKAFQGKLAAELNDKAQAARKPPVKPSPLKAAQASEGAAAPERTPLQKLVDKFSR